MKKKQGGFWGLGETRWGGASSAAGAARDGCADLVAAAGGIEGVFGAMGAGGGGLLNPPTKGFS